MPHTQNSAYRPDIDGLRAIAVLSVVLFHTNKQWLPGGFVGVDIFFVISGYLITLLVYKQILAGQFSFKEFYRRRINRIFPALFTVTAATLLTGAVILSPVDLVRLVKSAFYAVIGVSNIFFWSEYGGYFSSGAEEAPLLHTWSLAVEEQFYIVWPLLLIFVARLSPKRLVWLAVAALAGTVAVSEIGLRNVPTASYYLLPTRFFELLIGSVLAILMHHRIAVWGKIGSTVAGVIGLAIIAGSFIWLDGTQPFPGLNALYPCTGAALVIGAGAYSDGAVARILAIKPMVFLGLISYSLYLWHWPVIAYFNYFDIQIGLQQGLTIFAISTALAYLSWRFIETPFRRTGITLTFPDVLVRRYVLPLVAVTLVSASVLMLDGIPSRFDPKVQRYEQITLAASSELRAKCHAPTRYYKRQPDPTCLLGIDAKSADVLFIGDSYANHYTGMVDELAKHDKVAVMDYTMDGCLPIKGMELGPLASSAKKCKLRNDFNYQLIQSHHYQYVILGGSWPSEGTPAFFEELQRGIENSVGIIVASGARPIIILNNPTIPNANNCPVRRLIFNRPESCDVERIRYAQPQQLLAHLKQRFPQITYIDPNRVICDDEKCYSQIGDVPLYRDNNHLNDEGSRLIGRMLLDQGIRLLPNDAPTFAFNSAPD